MNTHHDLPKLSTTGLELSVSRSNPRRISAASGWDVDLGLFAIGALINALSYFSLEPVVTALLFFGLGIGLLWLTPLGGRAERLMFCRVFAVNFLMAGVAAVFANQLFDETQLFSDPSGFFACAAGDAEGLSIRDIQILREGPLVIVIWRWLYELFGELGSTKGPYIGISLNFTAVALAGVLGIKMLRRCVGDIRYHFDRLTLLISSCGLFWLFGAIHLRDAMALLFVTAVAFLWVWFLTERHTRGRLVVLVAGNLGAIPLFGFLRGEFVFVPIAFGLAAVGALLCVTRRGGTALLILLLFVSLLFTQDWIQTVEIFDARSRAYESYLEGSQLQHQGKSSLGLSLIVEQPLPLRLPLGTVCLLFSPIPFWAGVGRNSAYHLFLSFNVMVAYLVIPLLIVSIGMLRREPRLRSPQVLFLLFVFLGMAVTVAGSSLETRHLGCFLLPMFVLSALPDLRIAAVRTQYQRVLAAVLASVFVVHISWLVIKSF
jgi:hypothetical protein